MASTPDNAASAEGIPWVERYRPKSLEEVSHQSEVVATLQNAVRTGRLPHLLLYGPPGSGKTSVALALCRQLWHPSQWRRRVLELNASDERGISVVRDKIKHFASLTVGTGPADRPSANAASSSSGSNGKQTGMTNFFAKAKKSSSSSSGKTSETAMEVEEGNDESKNMEEGDSYPNPPFKIIILDEADTVTPDAQAALRRIIEAHSRITRFILICNYVTRIIEPLASRCAKFRFQSLPPSSMKERLQFIAKSENCQESVCKERTLATILDLAEGDMRRAVQMLQSVNSLYVGMGLQREKGVFMIEDEKDEGEEEIALLSELAGLPPPSAIQQLITAMETKLFDKVRAAVREVCANGYSAQFILQGLLQQWVMADPSIPSQNQYSLSELSKAKLSIRMAQAEANMMEGADEYLQLMTVCGLGMECLSEQQQTSQHGSTTNSRAPAQ